MKPVADGSSFGVVIVPSDAATPPGEIATDGAPDDVVMVEQFIPGRELTCAVIGDFVSDVTEILPADDRPFYDFASKVRVWRFKTRHWGQTFTRCLPKH